MRHKALTDEILRAFFRVANSLPADMPESMYQRALIILLQAAGLEVESEVPVRIFFRGQPIGDYRLDLIVEGVVIVECKVAGRIHSEHTRQLLRYLRITRMEVGLVLNFGPTAQCKRVAHTPAGGRRSGRRGIPSA